jgi:hypothetical protein
VKVTVKGAVPDVRLAVKLATGAGAVVALTSFENPVQIVLPLLHAVGGEVVLFAVLQAGEDIAGLIAGIDVASVAPLVSP